MYFIDVKLLTYVSYTGRFREFQEFLNCKIGPPEIKIWYAFPEDSVRRHISTFLTVKLQCIIS